MMVFSIFINMNTKSDDTDYNKAYRNYYSDLIIHNESVEKLQNNFFVLFSRVFLPFLIVRSSIVGHSPKSFFFAFRASRRFPTYSTGSTKKSAGAQRSGGANCYVFNLLSDDFSTADAIRSNISTSRVNMLFCCSTRVSVRCCGDALP